MSQSPRSRKLGERIQVIIAEMLERRVKDPRLGFVTITEARITNDLREATVFYTVLGDDQARLDSAAALRSATGLLRSEVGRQTGVKFTPTLEFILDALPENARHIDELLVRARAADQQVARLAATAEYAGDARPYRDDEDEGLVVGDGGAGAVTDSQSAAAAAGSGVEAQAKPGSTD